MPQNTSLHVAFESKSSDAYIFKFFALYLIRLILSIKQHLKTFNQLTPGFSLIWARARGEVSVEYLWGWLYVFFVFMCYFVVVLLCCGYIVVPIRMLFTNSLTPTYTYTLYINGAFANRYWEWTGIEIGNMNQNKLLTLIVGIRIRMSCIVIDVFALSWN